MEYHKIQQRQKEVYFLICENWTVDMEDISEGEASICPSVKTEGPCVFQYIWRMSWLQRNDVNEW